jgi:hypothetical protein
LKVYGIEIFFAKTSVPFLYNVHQIKTYSTLAVEHDKLNWKNILVHKNKELLLRIIIPAFCGICFVIPDILFLVFISSRSHSPPIFPSTTGTNVLFISQIQTLIHLRVYKIHILIDIEGPVSYFSTFAGIGGVHIGARALLDIKFIWFGYITRLSQWGEGGYFPCSNYFYQPNSV